MALAMGRERILSQTLLPQKVLVSRGKGFSRGQFWNLILNREDSSAPPQHYLPEGKKEKKKKTTKNIVTRGRISRKCIGNTVAREGNRDGRDRNKGEDHSPKKQSH